MKRHRLHLLFVLYLTIFFSTFSGCGSGGGAEENSGEDTTVTVVDPDGGPPAGNTDGNAPIPPEGHLEDVSAPDQIIGLGTPESCNAESFIDAVALGGTIVFDCGPDPITLTLPRPAKIFNDADPDVIIDGGGLVTLSGGGKTRILYMNTCDPDQVWTTSHCQDQDHPRLTVQNLTFANGDSTGEEEYGGGGAIWVRGGRFKAVNSRFFNNRCADTGPDVGGERSGCSINLKTCPSTLSIAPSAVWKGMAMQVPMAAVSAASASHGLSSTAFSPTTAPLDMEPTRLARGHPAAAAAVRSTTTATP
jgi:hypothetical protein